MHEVCIIGGGPAGLTAAWELRDRDILVLEQAQRLGGRLFSLPRGDFWMNFGAHLIPAPGSHLRNLMAAIGLEAVAIPGNKFALVHAGKVVAPASVSALPLTLPLSVRERVMLARTGLRIRKAVRAWQEVAKPLPGESGEMRRARASQFMSDRSFRDFLGPLPERIEALFRAAGQRAAGDPEDFTAGVGVALFGLVWAGSGGSALASNVLGGSGRLGEVMAERLGPRGLTGAKATGVVRRGSGYEVTFEREGRREAVSASQVIVAVPAMIAADIVEELPEAVSATLRRVRYGAFPSMGVVTSETGPMPWDGIYAITVPGSTINMMFHHTNPLRRPGAAKTGSSFMVYSGGTPAAEMMKLGEDQIRERYLADMFKVYPQLTGIIQETRVQKWSPGNTFRPPRFDFHPVVEYCARTDTDVHLAGDYFADIGSMETASGTGFEAAQRARTRLDARGRGAHLDRAASG